MPIAGYLMASAYSYTVPLFGLEVPPVFGGDGGVDIAEGGASEGDALSTLLFYAHLLGAALVIAAASLHAAGALRHEYVLKDNTFRRMTPLPPRDDDYAARTTRRSPESEAITTSGRT